MYKEVEGDLIALAQQGQFDVIAHGCNCFCTMGAGIAPQMAKAFGADKFPLELEWEYTFHSHDDDDGFYVPSGNRGDINKLGQIDYRKVGILRVGEKFTKALTVVNAYTQYQGGANLDYAALKLCLIKMNMVFKGQHIGLPMIGCGIAGGNWQYVKSLMKKILTDVDVTVVIYKPKTYGQEQSLRSETSERVEPARKDNSVGGLRQHITSVARFG